MAVQAPRGGLPLAVGLDERLERSHELGAVLAFPALYRGKQGVAVQPQRVGVLEREQQLERAEVARGAQPGRAGMARPRVTVATARRAVMRGARQGQGLQGAPALVVGAPRVAGGHRAPRAGAPADPRAHALAELVELLVAEAGEQGARHRAGPRDQRGRRLLAQRRLDRVLVGLEDDGADAAAQAEGLEAAGEL